VDHFYLDDAGPGPSTTYNITARASGATTANTVPIVVKNSDPVFSTLKPTAINLGGTETLRGTFTDFGVLDDHVVTITWGDGTTSTTSLAANVFTFRFDHVYADRAKLTNNPLLHNVSVKVPVIVEIADKDGGKATRPTVIIVKLP
jgi:hypothetical protein